MTRLRQVMSDATLAAIIGALIGLILLARNGLRSFWLTDYAWEALPAMSALDDGDPALYLERLPAYGGALLLETPFVVFAPLLSEYDAMGTWRALAIPGLLLFAGLAVMAGRQVAEGFPGGRGTVLAALTALAVTGSPVALLALQFGHSEDLLVTGLALLGVVQAGRGHPVAAGICVGLAAAGKPSALVVVPVVLVAAGDARAFARSLVAVVAAGAVLLAAPAAFGQSSTAPSAGASATASGIFKPTNVFWFLGRPNPRWAEVQRATTHLVQQPDPALATWAQRLEPPGVGRLSHPLIVIVALAMAAGYAARRRTRGGVRDDLLLLAAAALWWRCLLDTWNNPYYALGAILALGMWEAQRRRPPLLACVASLGLVLTQWFANLAETTPDAQAASYLTWAVPLGAWLVLRSMSPTFGAAALARLRVALERRAPTFVRWLVPSTGQPSRAVT